MSALKKDLPNTKTRALWTSAFVVWLCVVWGHSLMSGEDSSMESSTFLFLIRPLFELFGNHDEELMSFALRKTAHFSEYAILMALACKMVGVWWERKRAQRICLLTIWVAAPCIDEAIQLTTPGRAGMVNDVLLDMAGGLFGLSLVWLVGHLRARRI